MLYTFGKFWIILAYARVAYAAVCFLLTAVINKHR